MKIEAVLDLCKKLENHVKIGLGYYRCDVAIVVNQSELNPYAIRMYWSVLSSSPQSFECFTGKTIKECFDRMDEPVSKFKSVKEQAKLDFTKSLAILIEQGRSIGMDVEVTALKEMMDRLSENILEDHSSFWRPE